MEMLRNRVSMIIGSMTIHITAKNISHPAPDSYKPASSYSNPTSSAASSMSLMLDNATAAQISIINPNSYIIEIKMFALKHMYHVHLIFVM